MRAVVVFLGLFVRSSRRKGYCVDFGLDCKWGVWKIGFVFIRFLMVVILDF